MVLDKCIWVMCASREIRLGKNSEKIQTEEEQIQYPFIVYKHNWVLSVFSVGSRSEVLNGWSWLCKFKSAFHKFGVRGSQCIAVGTSTRNCALQCIGRSWRSRYLFLCLTGPFPEKPDLLSSCHCRVCHHALQQQDSGNCCWAMQLVGSRFM